MKSEEKIKSLANLVGSHAPTRELKSKAEASCQVYLFLMESGQPCFLPTPTLEKGFLFFFLFSCSFEKCP